MRHNYQKLMTLIPDLRGWPKLHLKVSRGKPPCLSSCQAMKIDHSLSTQVRFAWEMPISTPHVEPRRSILCGKCPFTNLMSSHRGAFCVGNSYLQTSGRAMEEHFAWEIPIYKLNLLLGGAFRVGNFYLQTQLERFVWEISIYKLN